VRNDSSKRHITRNIAAMNAADWLLISESWRNTMPDGINAKASRDSVRYVE
jgi:hypothetical protein